MQSYEKQSEKFQNVSLTSVYENKSIQHLNTKHKALFFVLFNIYRLESILLLNDIILYSIKAGEVVPALVSGKVFAVLKRFG